MEQLRSLIPDDLKRMIGGSTPEQLPRVCSSLLDFLRLSRHFHRVIGELTDPELALCRKSTGAALDSKRKGNAAFSEGNYAAALRFYSEALRHAPMSSSEIDDSLVAVLYVNRAASLQKMGFLEECLRDCDRALAISPVYVKAWYRRGKANALLKKYDIATLDLQVALSMEGSSSGKKHITEDLAMVLNLSDTTSATENSSNMDDNEKSTSLGEQNHTLLKCVPTPSKGRGMVSMNDILPASLVHSEEPLAAIVTKSFRETHCHFCFNEVPVDVIFCPSCTIPVYCSHHCQELAGGGHCERNHKHYTLQEGLPSNLEKHVMNTISANDHNRTVTSKRSDHIPEHRHECGGVHWSAVLPSDVVLAGRVMVNFIRKRSREEISEPGKPLDFSHNYLQLPLAGKLELHIYAVVLTYCLQHYFASDYEPSGSSIAQLMVLLSQVRINSMAVVHMKSVDGHGAYKNSLKFSATEDSFTASVEQVKVGQALYSTGSLFNHSCVPNIHAYFLSRNLLIRSTEFVPAGYPLELSYGPQVGQWDLQARQELLNEQYSFRCQCSGCSEMNLSDLVINAFSCMQPDCLGAVLEFVHFTKLEDSTIRVSGSSFSCELSLPVSQQENDVNRVAGGLLQQPGSRHHFNPGYCLSCGAHIDLESASASSKSAMMNIERSKDSVISDKSTDTFIVNILKNLDHLRSVRHEHSKFLAQAEDIVAETFVKIGECEHALQHCQASIKILEKLYHPKHIVVGNELMKLASIQLALADRVAALDCIERLQMIISLYYGSHASKIFPYMKDLREAVDNLC